MEERNLVFDYARELAEVRTTALTFRAGMRGELAGKTFVALQNVLDLIELSEKVNEIGSPCVNTDVLREAIRRAF